MNKKKCFICDTTLSEINISKEHIIKNSLGGRKKTKNFICKECNNKTGSNWDDKLENNFNEFLSSIFKIKRQRGKVQPVKIKDENTNKNYEWLPNKIRQITPQFKIRNNKYEISAKDSKSLNNFRKNLEKNNKIPNNIQWEEPKKIEEPIQISTNLKFNIPSINSVFTKSIIKSSLALIAEEKYNILKFCNIGKKLLTQNIELGKYVKFFYKFDIVVNRPFGKPLHIIYIKSIKNKIYAYVELYSIARYKILLSDNFDINNTIELKYIIDPTIGKELDLNISCKDAKKLAKHPGELLNNLIEEYNFIQQIEYHYYKCLYEYISNEQFNISTLRDKTLQCYITLLTKNSVPDKFHKAYLQHYEYLIKEFIDSVLK